MRLLLLSLLALIALQSIAWGAVPGYSLPPSDPDAPYYLVLNGKDILGGPYSRIKDCEDYKQTLLRTYPNGLSCVPQKRLP